MRGGTPKPHCITHITMRAASAGHEKARAPEIGTRAEKMQRIVRWRSYRTAAMDVQRRSIVFSFMPATLTRPDATM
jgi:hypothetical protein